MLFVPAFSFAQTENPSITHYRSGEKHFETRSLGDENTVVIEYFSNGHVKDSTTLRKEVPFGKRKVYFKNGQLRYEIDYINGPAENTFVEYRSDGSIKSSGGTRAYESYGVQKTYNRKGRVVRWQDMNKGHEVSAPKAYQQGDHISASLDKRFSSKTAYLVRSGHHSRKIRQGAIVSLNLNDQSLNDRHFIIEGFSNDSMLVSVFTYDTLSRSKNTLKFESLRGFGFNQIASIAFGKNRKQRTEAVAMGISTVGAVAFFGPLMVAPATGDFEALSDALNLSLIVAGPPLYFWGRHLLKATVPKNYDLQQWKMSLNK